MPYRNIIWVLSLVCALLAPGQSVCADEQTAIVTETVFEGPYEAAYSGYAQDTPQTPIHKFGRGVTGFLTSWVEIPKQTFHAYQQSEGLRRLVKPFGGAVKGAGLCLARAGIGIYEVATFLVPYPRGYASAYEALGLRDDPHR